jgi:heparin binding hemagglutinin HbhA
MPNLPTQEELRKAGEQAANAARTPLLAALGAGDLATKAVIEALNKAKTSFDERSEAAKSAVDELPTELSGLREKLDPAELRKLVDAYTQSALHLYSYLAEQGEATLEKFRAQPQVQKATAQVEGVVDAAQKRAESAAADARELADDVLGKVTRRTRSVGEKAARSIDDASEALAETVEEVGGDVAHEVRSTTRKAANRTAPTKPAATTAPKPAAAKATTTATRTSTTRKSPTSTTK